MRIRGDLDGVVHIHGVDGVIVLKGGDTIPAGVNVGDHLIEAEPKKPEPKESDGAGVKRGRGRPPRQATDT